MASFSSMIALLFVAFALLASYASAQCAIANCNTCALESANLCLSCNAGYTLNANGACVTTVNGAIAPQSAIVAALVVLASMLTYVL